MTRLKRASLDLCFFGGKGRGKNVILAHYGFKKWLEGWIIYSNFHLHFPYTPVRSLNDFEVLNLDGHKALFLFDDAEDWLSSRRSLSTQNLTVSNIIIKLGKRNVFTLWTTKRPKNVEIELRNTSDYFARIQLVLMDVNKVQEVLDESLSFDDLVDTVENLGILMTIYDYEENKYKRQVLVNLPIWMELFDTREEVKKLEFKGEKKQTHKKTSLVGGGIKP